MVKNVQNDIKNKNFVEYMNQADSMILNSDEEVDDTRPVKHSKPAVGGVPQGQELNTFARPKSSGVSTRQVYLSFQNNSEETKVFKRLSAQARLHQQIHNQKIEDE